MKNYLKIALQLLFFIFPWILRKSLLKALLNIQMESGVKIGFSILLARKTVLKKGAVIKNFTFINAIDYFEMGAFSKIGNSNWITGSSAVLKKGYAASPNRKCELIIGTHTRITAKHFFDCNGGIYIGAFTTIAGRETHILTHGIDVIESQQMASAVHIGSYCFIGTRCLLLKDAALPSKCILAGGAVLSRAYTQECTIYGGVPAKPIKELPHDSKYFFRTEGNVN